MKKTSGRKLIGDKPLTSAQKMERKRVKQACYIKAAESSDYGLCPVLISNKQLETLQKFYYLESHGHRETRGNGTKIDNSRLNEVIYYAMKMYLESYGAGLIKQGHPADLVSQCANTTNYPADYNDLTQVEVNSAELFKQWELSQITTTLKESK